jgi:CheY-like chemotaxis protein
MRALHQIPGCEDLPVIFVTGRATPEVVENLRKEGAREVFGKPFSPLQLIHLIGKLTESPAP